MRRLLVQSQWGVQNFIFMTENNRQQWFKDRIGKVVWRNKTTCTCPVCEHAYEYGLLIIDEMHAVYLYDCEAMYTIEGYKLRYFDTKEERDVFENTL
jgi:hypothetical protein